MMFDVLIHGGFVVDGSGAPGMFADVGVRGGRISSLETSLVDAEATRRIDATGQVVCPGFIDAHSHSDLTLLSDPRGLSKIQQGVTTEVIGNCGLAVAPVADRAAIQQVRSVMGVVNPDPSVAWEWSSMGEYLDHLDQLRPALNVAALAGHGVIRASVIGTDNRAASAVEQKQMNALLDQALGDGAIGLSTGLSLPPASFATTQELIDFGDVVKAHGAIFAMHLRTYGAKLLEAVAEAIQVGETTGCRVQISHLVATGRAFWGTVPLALELIEAARMRGVRVSADIYPYTAGSGSLTEMLPLWVHDGGPDALTARVRSTETRTRIRQEWRESLAVGWEDVMIAWVRPEGDTSVVGKRITQVAEERGINPDLAALDLLAAEAGQINMIAFGRSEDDLRAALVHPAVCIGSDGLAVDPEGPSGAGQPHPRGYGTYPRLLEHYVHSEHLLPLEQAIYKSTGLVADIFGWMDRGRVQVGAVADLVVFDPERIHDHATYIDPQRFPDGITTVLVGGQVAVQHGQQQEPRLGQVLRGAR